MPISVSVIIPCYNEQDTITLLLDALLGQTYPRQDIEVVISDGLSTDETRQRIQDFSTRHPDLRIRIVDNPHRGIPAGLNRALDAARGEVIVRLDAHSVPEESYLARCVNALESGYGANVGGVWQIKPRNLSWQARSIAVAASHRLGVGDAHYRFTDRAQVVDTVPFGAFFKSLVEQIGPFDETLLTNEDYEFNVRVRQSGGKVWLDPAIRSIYFARATFAQLARQYWRYGFWKAVMLRRYPETIRWRQALPPLFILSLLGFLLLSIWFPVARWIFMLELITYFLILLIVGFHAAIKQKDVGLIFGLPLAIATMHFCWGSAFLWSLIAR